MKFHQKSKKSKADIFIVPVSNDLNYLFYPFLLIYLIL